MLDKGDMLFKSLGINQPLAVGELPHVVNIEGYNIHTRFFVQHSDILGYNDNLFQHIRNLDSSQTGNGAIFTCGGFSILLIWGRNGCMDAVLLEFRLIR